MFSKVLVSTHVSQVYAPSYPLINFFKSRTASLITLLHPFLGEGIKEAQVVVYQNGEIEKRILFERWSDNQWINFLTDFFRSLFYAFTQAKNYDLYIGVNPLNVLPGIIVRFFFRNKTVVYYSADYSKQRFEELIFNDFYLSLDKFCAQRSDFCWSVSERIRDVRREQGVSEERNLLVPNGVHVASIKQRETDKIIPYSLVYVGHLTKTKGIFEIVEGFAKAVGDLPKLRLYIIGSGPEEVELKRLVEEKGLQERVEFWGRMSNEQILQKLSKFAVGLAPYNLNDNYTYYCDPVKVKEYLAAGLPVIITNAVWVSSLIEEHNCGVVLNSFVEELPSALISLFGEYSNYENLQSNAQELGAQFDWDIIYQDAVEKTET